MAAITLPIKFSRQQYDFFFKNENVKYNLMTKGRRVGFTHGAMSFLASDCLRNKRKVLWVDTIHRNINRYVDRYLLPTLNTIPKEYWHWDKTDKEMTINESLIDFGSAERAELIEGFGYDSIYLNEAGIILKDDKGRALWNNTILPMTMDYANCRLFIGGTPKGKYAKDGNKNVYYELYERAEAGLSNYHGIRIPTNENPFLPSDAVEEVKNTLPEGPVRDQEFYGLFVESGDSIIKPEWIQISDISIDGDTVRSWDIAATVKKSSDYSAGALCTYDGNKFQAKDMKWVKLLWPELKKLIIATAEIDGPDVPIILENAGQQNIVISDLKAEPRLMKHTIVDLKPSGDKLSRAMLWVSRMDQGKVSFLRGGWNMALETELKAFTADDTHAHDDQIDAISQAWSYFAEDAAGVGMRRL